MDNSDIKGYTTPEFAVNMKTQVITTYSRQRRMKDFMDIPGTMYMALGKQTPWKSENDQKIDDTHQWMLLGGDVVAQYQIQLKHISKS